MASFFWSKHPSLHLQDFSQIVAKFFQFRSLQFLRSSSKPYQLAPMSHEHVTQNPMVQPPDPAAMIPSNPIVESDKISKYCSQRLWQHLEACCIFFHNTKTHPLKSSFPGIPTSNRRRSLYTCRKNCWLFKTRRCLNGWTDVGTYLANEAALHRNCGTPAPGNHLNISFHSFSQWGSAGP